MKKYVFFIREYNDWDNIAPIIYYLAQDSSLKISICFYKTDLRHTSQFKYLEKNVGQNLQVFYFSPKKLLSIINFSIRVFNKFSRILKLGKIFNLDKSVPEKDLARWFEIIKTKECSRIVVIFDRMLTDLIYERVRYHLQGMDNILVSCSHGSETCLNRMKYIHQMRRAQNTTELLKYLQFFEYFIVSDYLELEFDEKFSFPKQHDSLPDKSRVKVLGGIRYCQDWLNHVDIFTPKIEKKNEDKIKVVFFMKKFAHNVFKDEVYRTIKLFASFPKIDFYIKPHTRGMTFSSKVNAPNIHIDYDSSSSSLIDMADVVFFYGGTSIILEALAKKKLTVCIDYLDCNRNLYDYFNACHTLKCRDDLCFFLDSIIAGKVNRVPAEKLLNEIVYARDSSVSVPDRYINFFKNL